MKLIYSELKKLLPTLDIEPQKLRDDLTMIGHFANYYETLGDSDFVIDLDIKVNRGDALGYYGIARDLSVLYQINLCPPVIHPFTPSSHQLPINILSPDVHRIMAAKITHVTVNQSPDWLLNVLKVHGINSINNIVDLTNYCMLVFGIPNHAFDTQKTGDTLTWENNTQNKYSQFTTLDKSEITLNNSTLLITNQKEALSLSFIGGNNSGIDNSSTEIILEMAIYNRHRVRQDSRDFKILTEAGIRLEKDLDPNLIPQAFDYLVSLILENTGGKLASSFFDHYPQKESRPAIIFDSQKPSQYSGINIPEDFVIKSLKSLGCEIQGNQVTPPTIRTDISLEEDLTEEVIRFWGYQNIPTHTPLSTRLLPDITPPILYLVEKLKDKLVALGYDEVRTWPLVERPINPSTAVTTQNSINSENTVLRQNLTQSLKSQLNKYERYKLPQPQFFEIGKVFSCQNGKYIENYALGLYHYSEKQLLSDLSSLNLTANFSENFAEIILDTLEPIGEYAPALSFDNSIELSSQIITLDANVDSDLSPEEVLSQYAKKIDPAILWQIVIADHYQNRYTFRVSYHNTSSKKAKETHFQAFNLVDQNTPSASPNK